MSTPDERRKWLEEVRARWIGQQWARQSTGQALNDIEFLLDEGERLEKIAKYAAHHDYCRFDPLAHTGLCTCGLDEVLNGG